MPGTAVVPTARATEVTTKVSGEEAVELKFAVMESLPAGTVVEVAVQVPTLTVVVQVEVVIAVLPFLKVMVPAVAGDTVALKVTLVPKGAVVTPVVDADVNAM